MSVDTRLPAPVATADPVAPELRAPDLPANGRRWSRGFRASLFATAAILLGPLPAAAGPDTIVRIYGQDVRCMDLPANLQQAVPECAVGD